VAADVRIGAEVSLLRDAQPFVEGEGISAEGSPGAHRVVHLIGVSAADRRVNRIDALFVALARGVHRPSGHRKGRRSLRRRVDRRGMQAEPHQRQPAAVAHMRCRVEGWCRFIRHETRRVQPAMRRFGDAAQGRPDLVDRVRAHDLDRLTEHESMRQAAGGCEIEYEGH
jgi:hypothetical protein